mgnify:CR=1 FL=1
MCLGLCILPFVASGMFLAENTRWLLMLSCECTSVYRLNLIMHNYYSYALLTTFWCIYSTSLNIKPIIYLLTGEHQPTIMELRWMNTIPFTISMLLPLRQNITIVQLICIIQTGLYFFAIFNVAYQMILFESFGIPNKSHTNKTSIFLFSLDSFCKHPQLLVVSLKRGFIPTKN